MPFSFTVLGTSSALPTSKRYPSAYVLNVHERIFLLDCGEGTQLLLRKYHFKMARLNHIFISHAHGDHTFGLFGLLSSLSLMGRDHDLHIYGSPELENIITIHLQLFGIELAYSLVFHSVNCKKSDIIYEDKSIIVESFPLKHRIPTCGFLFREKPQLRKLKKEMLELYQIPIENRKAIKEGADFILPTDKVILNSKLTNDPPKPKSFAYCTDTRYHRGMVNKINNVDLLFHEATFMESEADRAKDTFHSTARQAANIAKEANVKKLVLGHFSARYRNLSPLLEEAREIFPPTELAEEGKVFIF